MRKGGGERRGGSLVNSAIVSKGSKRGRSCSMTKFKISVQAEKYDMIATCLNVMNYYAIAIHSQGQG